MGAPADHFSKWKELRKILQKLEREDKIKFAFVQMGFSRSCLHVYLVNHPLLEYARPAGRGLPGELRMKQSYRRSR